MSEPDIDARFPFLPLSDQKRIDEAFLSQLTTEPLYVASQLASDTEGGGFVVDEPEPSLDPTLKIHISSIPRALESIQLPSDARVLITFRHAAIEDLDEDFEDMEDGSLEVSLKDFRSICAVLVENERDVNMRHQRMLTKTMRFLMLPRSLAENSRSTYLTMTTMRKTWTLSSDLKRGDERGRMWRILSQTRRRRTKHETVWRKRSASTHLRCSSQRWRQRMN
jgi:hypothetical protein